MALGTQPVGKLLDFEQFIEHQIERTRARIKTTDLLTAGLMLVTVGLGVLFLEVVLDHQVGLPVWFRGLVFWTAVVAAVWFSARRIVLPLISRINGFYAAKTIEEADPEFKNSLMTYLDLRRQRQEGTVSKAAYAAVEAKAVKDLTRVEIDSVVNQRRLLQVAYALSGVVVVFCLYAALTPKSILDSTRRAFLADVVRPTNTRLEEIKPGDDKQLSRVAAGSDVAFSVRPTGVRPRNIVLHSSVDGGKYYSKTEFAQARELLRPLAADPARRPAEHGLLPHGG
ncbi:MAG: hypothetical protein U0835_11845 [Isosphaeraceae bacterium]